MIGQLEPYLEHLDECSATGVDDESCSCGLTDYVDGFDYAQDLPVEKGEPLNVQVTELLRVGVQRAEAYEPERREYHWENDHAYRHIERAFGEFALAYWMSRAGTDREEMRREIADGINHLLMALDIGPENYQTKQ